MNNGIIIIHYYGYNLLVIDLLHFWMTYMKCYLQCYSTHHSYVHWHNI